MARPAKHDKEIPEDKLSKMTRKQITAGLTDKKIRFAEEYVKNFNTTQSAKNAGYSHKAAHVLGWKLKQKPEVINYIRWLKLAKTKQLHIDTFDIISQYMKIAFADTSNYVRVRNGKLRVRDTEKIDGTIVTEIKQGRDGITIKLADKMRALEKLERYLDVMPKTWQQKVEERKVELMSEKLELEKQKAGALDSVDEDDGFIEALKESAKEVWSE